MNSSAKASTISEYIEEKKAKLDNLQNFQANFEKVDDPKGKISYIKIKNTINDTRGNLRAVERQVGNKRDFKVVKLDKNIGGQYDPNNNKKSLNVDCLEAAKEGETELKEICEHEDSHQVYYQNLKSNNLFTDKVDLLKHPAFENVFNSKDDLEYSKELLLSYENMNGSDKVLDSGDNSWVIEALNCIYDQYENNNPIPEAYSNYVSRMKGVIDKRNVTISNVCWLYENGYSTELAIMLGLKLNA